MSCAVCRLCCISHILNVIYTALHIAVQIILQLLLYSQNLTFFNYNQQSIHMNDIPSELEFS